MVTRKTRLTSGLAAVLMLVSMFTAIVLPASASDASLYPYVRDMETLGKDSANDWGIGSVEDWCKAIELNKNGESFAGKTLHFTADIDFDVDGSGVVETDEYIDTLGGKNSFSGSINGHGHVIKNLYIDHDIGTEGKYAGLIGYGAGTSVIRDLGLESGKVNIHGTASLVDDVGDYCVFTGAFMGRHTGTITYANCWSNVEVYADVKVYEIDMAPFGRLSTCTLINCNNTGELTAIDDCVTTKDDGSSGTGTTRVDALLDWTGTGVELVNCYSVCSITGSGKYLLSFGSAVKEDSHYATIASNVRNTYANGISSVSNKSGVNKLLTDVKVDYSEYTSGELACRLNENYDATYDSVYGHKYYMVKDGRISFTDDRYEALYKLTVSKKIGDYVVESNTYYHNALDTVQMPEYEGYVLASYSEAVFPLDDGTFRMPAENATLEYVASEPDWGLIEEMIAKYQGYKTSGQHKLLENGAAVLELLDKLEMTYAAKDTMDDETALKRIALYVEQDRNIDLKMRDDLTYPDYPQLRNLNVFGRDASTEWAIASKEDWLYAIELSKDGETFAGLNLHFTNDIDFEDQNMEPLCPTVNFAGDIDGHGHVIKRMKIEVNSADTATKYVGLIGRAVSTDNVKVIKNLGIASGSVIAYSVNNNEAFAGAFMGHSYNTYFINCWNAASVTVLTAEGSEKGIGVPAMIGRVGTGTEGGLINCFNLGDMIEDSNGGFRASGLADWIKGPFNIINCFNAGTVSASTIAAAVNFNTTAHYGTAVIKNFYTTRTDLLVGVSSSAHYEEHNPAENILDNEAETTGELAWLMNTGYEDPTPYLPAGETSVERPYYTVKDGAIALGTAEEQPVKIAVTSAESVAYYYAMVGQSVDLNGDYIVGAPTYTLADSTLGTITNGVLTLTAVPADCTAIVNVSFSGGLDYAALNQAIASIDTTVDMDNYRSSKSDKKLDVLLTEVKAKVYTTQDAIDADVELLNSYSFMISISEYEDNKNADGYSVATKAEMEALADVFANLSADQTVYITADIDMEGSSTALNDRMAGMKASIDGMNHTISNLHVDKSWLGDFAGAYVKDLTFENCGATTTATGHGFLISKLTKKTEISNVKLDNVTMTASGIGTSTGGIQGVLLGYVSGGDLTLKDITIVNSTLNRPTGVSSKYWNSGIVFGKTYDGKVYADGIYLNNNTITGERKGSGTGIAFGEIICSATIKNVGIFNTTANDDYQLGVLSTMMKENTTYETQPKMVIENVIALNNGETVNLIGTDESYKTPITVKNAYTDTTKIAAEEMATLTIEESAVSANAIIASGEAAYKINATGTDKTWAMDNGLPVFAEEGAAVKVTFKTLANQDLAVLYTDAEGKLIGLTDDIFNAVSAWEGYETKAELEAATFAADTVINQAECNHNYVTTINGDGTHTVVCTAVGGCGENKTENCTYTYAMSTDGENHSKSCTVCGDVVTEACTTTKTHVAGTANADAKHTVACTLCNYQAEVACQFTTQYVEHTTETKGYTRHTCDCGYSYDVEDAEFLHDFSGVGTVVKKPTYATAESDGKGMSETKCAVCEAVQYNEIPALTLEAGVAGIVVKAPETATGSDTVKVTLELVNNPGIAGINMGVTYDPAVLTLEGIENAGLFGQFVGPKGGVEAANGYVPLTFLNATNLNAADTDGKALVTLTFAVKDDAAFGYSDISVEMIKGKDALDTENTGAANEDGAYVTVYGSSTMVEIVDYLWGDADGDGATGIPDALMILQWKVGLVEDSALKMEAADADRDGAVGIPDALMILQWKVGLVGWDPNGSTVEPA